MPSHPPPEPYLTSVIGELIKLAHEAKALHADKRAGFGDAGAQFEAGRALAYYEVVSLFLDQLDGFGIARAAVGVAPSFDPDELL